MTFFGSEQQDASILLALKVHSWYAINEGKFSGSWPRQEVGGSKKHKVARKRNKDLNIFHKDPVQPGKIMDLAKLQAVSSSNSTIETYCPGVSQLSRKHHGQYQRKLILVITFVWRI